MLVNKNIKNYSSMHALKYITTCLLFLFVLIGTAQSPEFINYQAVVRDGSGNITANQNVGIQLSILQSTAQGSVVYQETFSPVTNSFGLVNLQIENQTHKNHQIDHHL